MNASPTVLFGLTALGVFHTLISLVAVVSGIWALARDKQIRLDNRLGQTYLVSTLVVAVSGLGIFQHGGFGPPHALSILTLLALAVGTVAATTNFYKSWSRYLQALAYSVTVLFHAIPGVTESLTRLPLGAPLVASADAPIFQPIYGALLLLFLVGAGLQLRWLRAAK
jgi:uncharacterized membrane protein